MASPSELRFERRLVPSRMSALHVLVFLALPGFATPASLGAQACLGFGGNSFLGPAGAVRHWESGNMRGFGGAVGFGLRQLAAKAQLLRFSRLGEARRGSGFVFALTDLAVKLPDYGVSLCPVATVGFEGIPSRGHNWGIGLALGHRLTKPGSSLAIIPNLIASMESSVLEVVYGDLGFERREYSAMVRGGIAFEFMGAFARPFAALNTLADGYVMWGRSRAGGSEIRDTGALRVLFRGRRRG